MAKGRERKRRLEMKWRRLIAAHGRSGKSVRAFCRGRGACQPAGRSARRRSTTGGASCCAVTGQVLP
jgi:hypothetical protein